MVIDPDTPVTEPDGFYGQKVIVRRIFSRIGTGRPQSVAVIGGRKTGKTSLINYLFHDTAQKQYLEDCSIYRFYKVTKDQNFSQNSKSFITGINRLLGAEGTEDGNHYNAMRKKIERLHSEGVRLIFLMDDFHLITSNKDFPLEFFSFLRSLANNYNLAYVTTSFLELQKLCVIKDIEESPFFNIFTNLTIGPLSTAEAFNLLASLTGMAEDAIKPVVEWCGASPYIVKLIAKTIESSSQKDLLSGSYKKIFYPKISGYFEEIVAILPQEALKALKSIARDKLPDEKEAYHLRPLLKQGFLTEEEEQIKCFSPAFSLFLKKDLSRKMLLGKI